MLKFLTSSLVARFLIFRKEVVALWHAFLDPLTPFYLKVAMVFVALYLFSPIDLVPDFIPILGFVDDLILVPMMVSWIVARLPVKAKVRPQREPQGTYRGKTINGTARRL